MKIINLIDLQLKIIKSWEQFPSKEQFLKDFFSLGHAYFVGPLGDLEKNYELFQSNASDWQEYREQVLKLKSCEEEAKIKINIDKVEHFFNIKLVGEVVLFVMFSYIDGYARFHEGTHRVFIGLTFPPPHPDYYDVLETHELTHVARESRPENWLSWGLQPNQKNEEFIQKQPALEHLFGEGFSCAVSELLNPGINIWEYVYQSKDGYELILKNADEVNRVIHEAIIQEEKTPGSFHYFKFYSEDTYNPPLPLFTQYVWAYAWVKELLKKNTPQNLLTVCSKDLRSYALDFFFNPSKTAS